jgi:hypothetical protein
VLDAGELALEFGQKVCLGTTLEHLAQKRSARRQYLAREVRGGFRERHNAQVVGLAVPSGIGRHIGEHNVCFGLPSPAPA